jgi:hypothetical protein
VPEVAYRLQNKLEELMDRLQQWSLVVPYSPSADSAEQKDYGLIRHLHEAIATHLDKYRYHLPGTPLVPLAPTQLEYDNLPWALVWYSTAGSTKKNLISDERRIAIPGINIDCLRKSPFGTGSTRPHILGDKRTVILISEWHDSSYKLVLTRGQCHVLVT